MQCKQFKKKLSAFQDNRLPQDQMEAMASHRQSCVECREMAEALESVWKMLSILPEPDPEPYFYTRLKARMEIDETSKPFSWIQRAFVSAIATVTLALGIFIGGMTGRFSRTSWPSTDDLFYELPLEELNVLSESSYASDYFEIFDQEGAVE